MRLLAAAVAPLLILASIAQATQWHVGASREYTTPSGVMPLVQDGDTVLVDPGLYTGDVGVWMKNNLHLIGSWGSAGYAHLDAAGNAAQQKAIWVISGRNCYVEGFEFSGCSVADHNGAGIRQEGTNVTIEHCYFHDNEDGILTGADPASAIVIRHSEFARNGYGDGQSHNMYIGHVRRLLLQFCYSHHAIAGHLIKSRADTNQIDCNFIADDAPGQADGTSSYAIDIPNAGFTELSRNILVKGPQAENRTLISYGEEGVTNHSAVLHIRYNTAVGYRRPSAFLRAVGTGTDSVTSLVWSASNVIAGFDQLYNVTSTVLTTADTAALDIGTFHFNDPVNQDFRLPTSIPGANIPGLRYQYRHPMDSMPRLDVPPSYGALQPMNIEAVLNQTEEGSPRLISGGRNTLVVGPPGENFRLEIFKEDAARVLDENVRDGYLVDLRPGFYFYRFSCAGSHRTGKIVIR